MNLEIGSKALVTTDTWFFAPDGKNYRAVYGTIKSVNTAEATLGIKPNGRSANWYLEIGNMTIAGCQVHYAVKTDKCNLGRFQNWSSNDAGVAEFESPSAIYHADGEQ